MKTDIPSPPILFSIGILVLCLGGCVALESGETGRGFFDDRTINARVESSFFEDYVISGRPVSARTVYGMVLLTGRVEDESERLRAEGLASGVIGVRDVINHLETTQSAIEYGERTMRAPGNVERSAGGSLNSDGR